MVKALSRLAAGLGGVDKLNIEWLTVFGNFEPANEQQKS